ncbi:MAG TPA: hypothetical protein VFQ39_15035 [Longimicrobium sp.]|nr:hypothetical protein [Longimicrobium sp.]
MAVDFAYKRRLRAREGWALRTAKLRMSRKLIYAAGLLACFSCAVEFEPRLEEPRQIGVFRVVDHLAALVRTPPLDIIARFARRFPELGAAADDLFGAYDGFLALLDDPERRGRLKAIPPEEAAADPVYGEVKKLGASFQHALDRFFFESDGTPLPSLTRKYGVF